MTNKLFQIQNNKVIFDDCQIEFPFPIAEYSEISKMLIVLLEIPGEAKFNENVFGLSLVEKEIKWQIERVSYKLQPFTKIPCKYNGISTYHNRLRLNNWCDGYVIVDETTGMILEKGATK